MTTPSLDLHWWKLLEQQWKLAFAEVFFRHAHEPTQNELTDLYHSPAIRFAGPRAPYPNMSFELSDLSGITRLVNLEIFVFTHQKIDVIEELRIFTKLKNLFLLNNKVKSLEGIEELVHLEQLYVQWNRIDSIKPVQKLTNLKEFYVHNNLISSLEGLTVGHSDKLEKFYCKPNELLKQKEIIRVENELGIRCRSL